MKHLLIAISCAALAACNSADPSTPSDGSSANDIKPSQGDSAAVQPAQETVELLNVNEGGVFYQGSYDDIIVDQCSGSPATHDLVIKAFGTDRDGNIERTERVFEVTNTAISYLTPSGSSSSAVEIDLEGVISMDANRQVSLRGRDVSGRPLSAELRCGDPKSYGHGDIPASNVAANGHTDASLTEYHTQKWAELEQLGLSSGLACEVMDVRQTHLCENAALYAPTDEKKLKTGLNQLSLNVKPTSNKMVTAIAVVQDENSPASERADSSGEQWIKDLDIQINGQSVGFLSEQTYGLTDVVGLSVMPAENIESQDDAIYVRVHMGTTGSQGQYYAQYLIEFENCAAFGNDRDVPYIAQQVRWSDIMGEGSLIHSQYGSMACN